MDLFSRNLWSGTVYGRNDENIGGKQWKILVVVRMKMHYNINYIRVQKGEEKYPEHIYRWIMAGIKEIAEKCNVSVGTVSNILNHKGNVKEETKEMVMKVVKELGYKPNYMAKGLKQRVTNTIGVITEDLTVFTTPEIVDGINEYCEKRNYQIILGNLRLYKKYHLCYEEPENMQMLVNNELQEMLAKQVAGVIYIANHERKIHRLPETFPIPIVCAYGFAKNILSVIVDDKGGGFQAARKLLEGGGSHIGLIAGEKDSFHTQLRLLGYQMALFEKKVPYNPEDVYYGDWERAAGYFGAKELIKKGVDQFVCMNDMMAGGIYEYADEKGMKVGEDISVVGFDNRDFAEWFKPQLTTIGLPLHELGYRAAELMLRSLEGKEFEKDVFTVPCPIVERKSIIQSGTGYF